MFFRPLHCTLTAPYYNPWSWPHLLLQYSAPPQSYITLLVLLSQGTHAAASYSETENLIIHRELLVEYVVIFTRGQAANGGSANKSFMHYWSSFQVEKHRAVPLPAIRHWKWTACCCLLTAKRAARFCIDHFPPPAALPAPVNRRIKVFRLFVPRVPWIIIRVSASFPPAAAAPPTQSRHKTVSKHCGLLLPHIPAPSNHRVLVARTPVLSFPFYIRILFQVHILLL